MMGIFNKNKGDKVNTEIKTISINGVEYVEKSAVKAEPINGEYKIVRTYSAGVFLGIVEKRNGKEATIRNARRLWQWSGAASLSQLATDGTSNPSGCKFPCPVDKIELTEVIEVLSVTEKAKASIDKVPVWKA
jgi:hypothetical protein